MINDDFYWNMLRYELKRISVSLSTDTWGWREAFEFARKAHNGQLRDEGTSYFVHICDVIKILWINTSRRSEEILSVASLHDVLEDNKTITFEHLKDRFGERVAKAVNVLTKMPDEPFPDYAKRIFENNEFDYLGAIKLADRLANLKTLPLTNNPAKIIKKIEETYDYFFPDLDDFNDSRNNNYLLTNKIIVQLNGLKTLPNVAEYFLAKSKNKDKFILEAKSKKYKKYTILTYRDSRHPEDDGWEAIDGYETEQEAIERCRYFVERSVEYCIRDLQRFNIEISVEKLHSRWAEIGYPPIIDSGGFNASAYALEYCKQRCKALGKYVEPGSTFESDFKNLN